MRRSRLLQIAQVVLAGGWLLASGPSALAWWNQGHERITEMSISHLPQPLKDFFQSKRPCVMMLAGQEPPGTHFIDIDAYPEFFTGTLTHDLPMLIGQYGLTVVNQRGTAPWTLNDYLDQLTFQMATATTPEDWDNLIPTAAALAHYAEDLHNPMHLTLNYNGQLSGNNGLHARYEGQMVLNHLSEFSVTPSPQNCVFLSDPIETVFDAIDIHYYFLDDILAADTAHRGNSPYTYGQVYYDGLWADTGAFTQQLFREASYQVASVWYTAWVNAGSPLPLMSTAPGDFDGGGIGVSDVSLFINGLLNQTLADQCEGDMNGDGVLNGADIRPFVNALLNP